MELRTPRLVLRELEERDAAAAHAYESLEHVVRHQSHGVRTLDESLTYIRASMALAREVPRRIYDLAVVLADTGATIGRVGLKVDEREGAIWYVLHPDCWGHGYAVEAARAMLELGFEELGLHRIVVDADPENVASRRVAEKLGMRLEAHFVENAWIKGRWTDSVIYALLEREWRA